MQVSRAAAARFLLYKQGLLSGTPGSLWRSQMHGQAGAQEALTRLECIQVDPVNVLTRNQHLVLAARVGEYQAEQMESLLGGGEVLDYICNARCLIPMRDWPLFKSLTNRFGQTLQGEIERLGEQLERVYAQIVAQGPITSRQLETSEKIVGWWDSQTPRTKASSQALEVLWYLGRIGVSLRAGNERTFDIIERVVPEAYRAEHAAISGEQADAALLRKYMRAHRLFFPGHFRFGWMRRSAAAKKAIVARMEQQGEIVPVNVEGVRRAYWVLAADTQELQSAENWQVETEATLLPPLDNLLWLRERLTDIFNFEYTWEIYTPEKRRKYGAYTLPLLVGDRFVGRLDAHVERSAGALIVDEFYPETWADTLPAAQKRALAKPGRQAVQLLAQACGVARVELADRATPNAKLLMPQ